MGTRRIRPERLIANFARAAVSSVVVLFVVSAWSRVAFAGLQAADAKTEAAGQRPNILVIVADDKYSHSMRERCFIHANQCFSWRMTDFRTIPNCGQFSPIP
jgi:hypothetical protein